MIIASADKYLTIVRRKHNAQKYSLRLWICDEIYGNEYRYWTNNNHCAITRYTDGSIVVLDKSYYEWGLNGNLVERDNLRSFKLYEVW